MYFLSHVFTFSMKMKHFFKKKEYVQNYLERNVKGSQLIIFFGEKVFLLIYFKMICDSL